MTFYDMLTMSIGNLWRRKLRTFLTVLGVLIGTTSIVAMLSLGIGMKQVMLNEFSLSSATQITVSGMDGYDESSSVDEDKMLSDSMLGTFANIEHVTTVDPQLQFDVTLSVGKYQGWATITGISEKQMKEFELAKGEIADTAGSKLPLIAGNCIISSLYYEQGDEWIDYYSTGELPDVDLMKDAIQYHYYNPYANMAASNMESEQTDEFTDEQTDAADETENVETEYSEDYYTSNIVNLRAEITGIMKGEPNEYTEYAYGMYVDIDTLKSYLTKNYRKGSIPGQPVREDGRPYSDWIYNTFVIEVDDADNVELVKQEIQDMGFSASSNKELLDEINKTIRIVELVLGGIGMIAFLVAAIGIANTMMMSTYERTKEIGIMKVLGCDMRDIQKLFLSEAGFIGLLGGMLGLGLSCLISIGVNYAAKSLMEMGNVQISQITWWLALIAIAFSTLMGMLAGYFPARRAMKLSALAAIRNE